MQERLFDAGTSSLSSRVRQARLSIRRLLLMGHPLRVAWSAGKDSWAVLNLVLTEAHRVKRDFDFCPPLVVTHADSLVDNPEITAHARTGMKEIEEYSARHGLNVTVRVSTPYLNDEFAVKIIGGRSLPVFPGKTHDCTIDWKVTPQTRLVKEIVKDLKKQGFPPMITLLGTRFDESAVRARRMNERQETANEVWANGKGEEFLSLIADWRDSDVWRYLAAVHQGQTEGVSRLDSLFRLYRDGASESRTEDGCDIFSCRFGCHNCTAGKDKSMEALLARDPKRYGYMEGLNRYQRFLMDTQWDFGRRQWIGRTMTEHGYIAIAPDVYSPAMLEELLRYALTLDVREIDAAANLGIAPRYQIVSARALIAIDAMWSLQGLHPAHHALKIFRDIYQDGHRYDIPDVVPAKRQPMPQVRYLPAGEGWRTGWDYSGLRNASLEAATFDQDAPAGCMGMRELPDGRAVLDVQRGPALDVDEEGAAWVLGMELDYLLSNYGDNHRHRTAAYIYYVSTGVLQLEAKQPGIIDAILKRSAFKEAMGLTDDGTDSDAILCQSVSKEEMERRIAANADSEKFQGKHCDPISELRRQRYG